MVVLDQNQTAVEWVVRHAGNSNMYEEVFIGVDKFGLFSALNKGRSVSLFEFFTVCTNLAEMAILYSKDLTTAKKVTSSGTRPDATDYYWFRSPVPNHMS